MIIRPRLSVARLSPAWPVPSGELSSTMITPRLGTSSSRIVAHIADRFSTSLYVGITTAVWTPGAKEPLRRVVPSAVMRLASSIG